MTGFLIRRIAQASLAWLALASAPVTAADHYDGPAGGQDPAVDLGDLYAWTSSAQTLAVALTVGPGLAPGEAPHWDRDVLYGIHFDEDGDSIADHSMWIQFAENPDDGELGVLFRAVPGAGDLVGATETVISGPGLVRAWAGVRDDPFVYDAEGWAQSLATGEFAFDLGRDVHAMTNVLAIVVELEVTTFTASQPRIWATANRWPR